MSLPAGTSVINGFAVSPDGALYVTPSGTASITGGNVQQISRCALPMVRSCTGNMGNNGAWTAGTAYGKTYGKCYIYFAANQIAAGVAAGWYYAEASSTTAFIVYNNVYTTGIPTIPASKTAFVTTGPGATTGDITEQGLLLSIAANQLGPSGWWKVRAAYTNNNSVGSKTAKLKYSGLGGTQLAGLTNTTVINIFAEAAVVNQGQTNAQFAYADAVLANSTMAATFTSLAIDTTAATAPAVTSQIGTATDWMVMEWAVFELMTDGT